MMPEISRSQLQAVIDEWIIGRNAERDRRIISRRLLDGITIERLAEEVDLSPRQTREIIHKCEAKLIRHLPG